MNRRVEVTRHRARATAQLTQLMSSSCCSRHAASGENQGCGTFWTVFCIIRTYFHISGIVCHRSMWVTGEWICEWFMSLSSGSSPLETKRTLLLIRSKYDEYLFTKICSYNSRPFFELYMTLLIFLSVSWSYRISVFSCVSPCRCIHIFVCIDVSFSVTGPLNTTADKQCSINIYESIKLSWLFEIPRQASSSPTAAAAGRYQLCWSGH